MQAGTLCFFPNTSGAGTPISHDGTVACDTVLEQADYPVLFATIGTDFNTGGETGTQFRTPKAPTWANDTDWEARIRF